MTTLVLNGWAAGPETWALCTFRHDWVLNYIEQLDGVPERVFADCDEALLVGFSMGGSSALRLALAAPEKVRGLVLVSATARMSEDPAAGWRGMSPRRRAALRLGTLLTFRGDPSPLYAEEALDRGLDYLDRTDLRAPLLAAAEKFRHFPVAVFQSDHDGIVRPSNADFLKSVFPQAEMHLVPGGEHVLPITVPKAISEVVTRFQNFS